MANDIYRIHLQGPGERYEAIANAAGTLPGMLVELISTGKYQVHATAYGAAEALLAIEDRLQGKGITDAYASGALVQAVALGKGSVGYGRINNGENIAIGDKLVSAGNGYLKKFTAEASAAVLPRHPIFVALEAVNMSGSSAVDPDGFCKVRAL